MISHLKLYDFRNHIHKVFDFNAKNVVFYGNNGKGKTNIIEAISILSVGKSWRETTAKDLINHQAESAKRSAKINGESFDIIIEQRSRQFFKNEKRNTFKNHFGKIPSLLFAPEHLSLFSGNKTERQKYFDRFLMQIYPEYRDDLANVLRAIKQKNSILKSEYPSIGLLQPWNKIIAEKLPRIIETRSNFLRELNPILNHELKKITQKDEPISLHLSLAEDFTPTSEGINLFFAKNLRRELASKRNLISPTRDDFCVMLRDRLITKTASRGEERSVLLALLAAQKHFLQKHNPDKKIILLLDDVFSELDNSRQNALEKICEDSQIFFTTTHLDHFAGFGQANIQTFEIE